MLKPMPKVAVLLATFNGAPWLREQVETITAQQDVDQTVIVSDDGSTDGTLELLAQLARADERIVVLPTQPPTRSSAANFARLIRQVNLDAYDYVALADQDDVWLPDKLTRAIAMLRQEQADGYSANVTALFEGGQRKLVEKAGPQQRLDHYFESPGPGCSFVLTRRLMSQLVPVLHAIERRGGRLFAYHDWFIYAFARRAGFKWTIDPVAPMLYRQHAHNVLGANIGIQPRLKRLRRLWSGWYFDEVRWQHEVLESLRDLMPNGQACLRAEDLNIDSFRARLRFATMIAPHARRRLRDRLWLGACVGLGIMR
jgi:rhamnosyltransferase